MSEDDDKTADAPHAPSVTLQLRDAWTRVLTRSRSEVQRAADEGYALIRIGTLQRDLEALRTRLGKAAFHLYEEGEIDHPAIAKTAVRMREIEDEIAVLREGADPEMP